jgi:chloramphenicol O-acetyltransferase type A
MKRGYLDLERWPRRPHFDFYRAFHRPFFNISTDVRVSALHRRTRDEGGPSFFLATLFACVRAANDTEEFRYRIRGDGVWVHDQIHIGSTVLRDDETFGFAYFAHADSFADFQASGREEIERVAHDSGLDPRDDRDDLLHTSVLPWLRFTSFMHARRTDAPDSVPKIVFGRHFQRGRDRWLPLSVEVHHALVDGLHIARFVERFEAQLADIARI